MQHIDRILFLSLVLAFSTAAAETIVGKVIAISDGDTLTVLTADKQQVKIRLAEIDTPEKAQPYGTKSRQTLSDLAFGKDARIRVEDTDRYGRTVGRVFVGSADVNAEMVKRGAAWVYRKYSHDPSLLAFEQQAKTAERGLWALPEAERMPPWEWRSARKSPSTSLRSSGNAHEAAASTGCGSKRACKEMTDCAEAKHYLNDCGIGSIDGDRDGIPCESLCKNR